MTAVLPMPPPKHTRLSGDSAASDQFLLPHPRDPDLESGTRNLPLPPPPPKRTRFSGDSAASDQFLLPHPRDSDLESGTRNRNLLPPSTADAAVAWNRDPASASAGPPRREPPRREPPYDDDDFRERMMHVNYGLRDTPGLIPIVVYGMQQYLSILGSLILIPLIIVSAMGGTHGDTAEVVSTVLFVSGVTTLLHTMFGTRLPLNQGPSFVFLAPALVIINSSEFQGLSNNELPACKPILTPQWVISVFTKKGLSSC